MAGTLFAVSLYEFRDI